MLEELEVLDLVEHGEDLVDLDLEVLMDVQELLDSLDLLDNLEDLDSLDHREQPEDLGHLVLEVPIQ